MRMKTGDKIFFGIGVALFLLAVLCMFFIFISFLPKQSFEEIRTTSLEQELDKQYKHEIFIIGVYGRNDEHIAYRKAWLYKDGVWRDINGNVINTR